MKPTDLAASSLPNLRVTVGISGVDRQHLEFSKPFRIGRVEECEVRITDDLVSRTHAAVSFENGTWWIRDLNSTNGLYSGGQRFERAPINWTLTIGLGIEGPEVSFEVAPPPTPDTPLRFPARQSIQYQAEWPHLLRLDQMPEHRRTRE